MEMSLQVKDGKFSGHRPRRGQMFIEEIINHSDTTPSGSNGILSDHFAINI